MANEEIINVEEDESQGSGHDASTDEAGCVCATSACVTLAQKVMAELIGTFFIVFAGCGAIAVNNIYGTVTFPGVCVTWGLIVMVMVYSVGHISGGHFNPAVSIAFAVFRHFPWKHLPLYIVAQLLGSIFASGVLCLVLKIRPVDSFVNAPAGSNGQAFCMEMIITFMLMFVVSGVATDTRAIGELAGFAVGMTILLNVFVAGPVSSASMNPARSIGPAIILNDYRRLWVFIVGPTVGAILGCGTYQLIRFTDKPLGDLTKSASLFKSSSRK